MRLLTAAGIIAAVTATALLVGNAAGAGTSGAGTGIQAGPARFTAAPGTISRARVTVANTGSGTETLTVRPYRLGGSKGPAVPASWIRGGSITLAAGASGSVTVTLAVPAGTRPGRYSSDLLASTSPGTPGGFSFGAAALTDLVVTVIPMPALWHR